MVILDFLELVVIVVKAVFQVLVDILVFLDLVGLVFRGIQAFLVLADIQE